MGNKKTNDKSSARVDEALTVLGQISDPRRTRNEVAQAYQLAVEAKSKIDWANVDKAIISRWSRSALQLIKQRAWNLE